MDEKKQELLTPELREFQTRVHLLDTRMREEADRGGVAALALEELYTASEELRVAEEELQIQTEQLFEYRERLERERRRYRGLFDLAPDAFLTTRMDGVITEANLAAGRMLRVTPERLAGKPLSVFIPESGRHAFRTALREIERRGSERRMHIVLTPRNGEDLHVEARVSAGEDDDGRALLWLFRELGTDAVKSGASQMMIETHHRVKNNLQVLAAMMDLRLLDDTPILREDIHRFSAAVRSVAIIHDLLTQSSKSGRDGRSISSGAFFNTLLPLLVQGAGGRALHADISEAPLPARQATGLALILNELISNAVKHGEEGVQITFAASAGDASLTVCDSGSGFPDGFDPQAAARTGLDLVLSLARWDLSGSVEFGSAPSGGGAVSVRFPLTTQPT